MTQLSRYFTLAEMTVSETAARRGLSCATRSRVYLPTSSSSPP